MENKKLQIFANRTTVYHRLSDQLGLKFHNSCSDNLNIRIIKGASISGKIENMERTCVVFSALSINNTKSTVKHLKNTWLEAGVISRGHRGLESLLLKFFIIFGGSAPLNSCIGLAFQSLLTLLTKYFLLL